MREVAVIGAGMIKFGKYPDYPTARMGGDAVHKALQHAGVARRSIQAAYLGNITSPTNCCQRVLAEAGISGIPAFNHENACASSSSAFRSAYESVATGVHDMVLAIGVENLTSLIASGMMSSGPLQVPFGTNLDIDNGMMMPAMFALIGRRHMMDYGTTVEQFAQIAVKNHKNSTMNPFAHYTKACSLEEVMNSAMICDPLTLYQCCPIGDGAAAVVLCAGDKARQYTSKPVWVKGSVLNAGRYKAGAKGPVRIQTCVDSAKEAYEVAGLGPEDLDVVELHDCFSIHELVAYEDLGLCAKGEGSRLVDEGITEIGGKVAVNTSGGLLSKGHPIGATGVAQIVEVVWQLRGECGDRQQPGAKVGLTHNGGGFGPSGEPGAMSIIILAR